MPARTFALPDLGEGLTSARVVRWLVAEGEEVVVDRPLVEVETAKALVEVPSPFAGTVERLAVAEGEDVPVGAPLLVISQPGADTQPEPTSDPGSMRVDEPGESGGSGRVLVGYGTASPPERRRQGTRRVMPPASSVGDGKGRHSLAEAGRPLAKPPVRKLAKDLGVDLETVIPTGSEGTITRDDVRRAASGQHAATGARSVDGYATERVEFTGVRGRVAEQTTRSRREIPSATARVSAEASELLATRDALAAAHPDLEISPLAVLLRIVVAGLREVGVLNAHVEEGGGALLRHRAIHLGVAVHTDRGLLVPVIRDAEQRSTIELARELGRVVDGARDASLAPAELSGSTFTVSNYGSLGIDGGDPVINPPEVGILGVGRIAARPWVVDGRVAVRPSVELALAFDHRACDGADAAAFLRLLAACLQDRTALVASL